MSKDERCLIIDESGNLGRQGRYFVIACIDTTNRKALHNIMRRKLGVAKTMFPNMVAHSNEVKACDAYPAVKYHILECISSKEVKISYIVADLNNVKPKLLVDKNILYNFLLGLLLEDLITRADNGKTINIICDKKTTKIASGNSFDEYIKLKFIYKKNLDIDINVTYLDSDAKDAFIVQAADYVANAIYTHYEYSNSLYYNVIEKTITVRERFPNWCFS